MKGRIVGNGEKTRYLIDNREVSKDDFDLAFPPVKDAGGSGLFGWKPILSEALAVHPEQVQEAIEDAKKKGVPTDFLPDGRAVLTSRSHRKAYLRAYGFHDRSGGYGD